MWEDVSTALRVIRRFRIVMLAGMATIAIVVAAVTLFASVVHGLLLWQPEVRNPEQLLTVEGGHSLAGRISYHDYEDYRDGAGNLAAVAALMFDGTSVTLRDQTEVVADGVVSANFFSTLGVSAALGRVFVPGEHGLDTGVILSERLWRRFGASADIIGETVVVYATPYTVIGVLPAEFRGFSPDLPLDIWLPVEGAQRSTLGPLLRNRQARLFRTVLRISPETTTAAVLDALGRVDVGLDQQFGPPRTRSGSLRLVNPRGIMDPRRRKSVVDALRLLGIALALILLIVCSNIASLMLAVMRQRRREIALRSALGASALRLLRQLGTEGVVIWGAAGVAGLLLACAAITVAMRSFPPRLLGVPLALGIQLNPPTLALSIGSCVAVGLFFTCIPALAGLKRSALRDIGSTAVAGDTGRTARAPGVALVALQVALSMALVVGNAQIIRSLYNASESDLGYETTGRVALYMHPNPVGLSQAAIPAVYDRLLERVRSLPGVRSAALVDFLPLSGLTSRTCDGSADAPPPAPAAAEQVSFVPVSPDYFKTLGIRLVAGRDFTDIDRAGSEPAIIVNRALAASRWPAENPIGQRLRIGPECTTLAQVVGVVEDAAQSGVDTKGEPLIYAPFDAQASGWRTLVAHVENSPERALRELRQEILMLNPGASIQRGERLTEELDVRLWPMRAAAAMMSVLGVVGVLVATSAAYALISTFIAARTREIGVRLALGATPTNIVRLVAPRCLVPAMAGLLIGLYLGHGATRLAMPVLYRVNPADVTTYSVAVGVLLSAIVVAIWLPVRKAVRIDPAEALRVL